MNSSLKTSDMMSVLIDHIKDKQEDIHSWLKAQEGAIELPIYSSVDIRDAGFKMAVVDTNIFPAGFNNLCEHGLEDAVGFLREAILRRVSQCKNILIIAEEHTRNTWYLENIRILQEITEKAGFNVKVATFLTVEPAFCEKMRYVELETATGKPVKIHCFKKILEDYEAGREKFCLIIMNNDLTSGVPEILTQHNEPIYPSISAGWHSRLKSHHFSHTSDLMNEFAKMIDVDPWLFSCEYSVEDQININSEDDRKRLAANAEKLFESITKKYSEHNIVDKPYLVIKADAGTYGMGVTSIESPQDILTLNRRNRNNMSKGKSAKPIERILIQEGVPTRYNINQEVSEVCIYQIENNLVGGFYRTNSSKSNRENLNSSGMAFQKICPHSSHYGDDAIHPDLNVFDVYRILARIAGIAAHREIVNLENDQK